MTHPHSKTRHRSLTALFIITVLAGAATLLPFSGASTPCILGYKALCSFSPISTVILFYSADLIWGSICKVAPSRS